jgi:hypothetical protein
VVGGWPGVVGPGESTRETVKLSLIPLKRHGRVLSPRDRAGRMFHRSGPMRPDVPSVRWRRTRIGWAVRKCRWPPIISSA